MNNIFARRLSGLLSLAALTQFSVGIALIGSGLSAQAETMDKVSTDIGTAPLSPHSGAPTQSSAGGCSGGCVEQAQTTANLATAIVDASATPSVESTAPADDTQSSLREAVSAVPESNPAQLENATEPQQLEQTTPTQEAASSILAPVPGTTATSAASLTSSPVTPQLVPAAETAASRVAQADIDTTPSPDSAPASPAPTPSAAVSFSDVGADYWAYSFIQGLAARNVIAGFPDGTFRPEQPVNRAELAAMLQKAFSQKQPVRQLSPGGFTDVPADYWAASAIQAAYEAGFLAGYPDNTFLPNQRIPKVQAIASLASGLALTPSGSTADIISTNYTDAQQIPPYAIDAVAAATQANVVVNYPDVKVLNPTADLTRAEAAAHLYQALVRLGQVEPLPSTVAAASYIVGGPGGISQAPPPETAPSPDTDTAQTPDDTDLDPGRATRGGSSYIGVGVNIGASGDTSPLGDTNFTVISKIGLLRNISVRPSVVIGGDAAFLIPVTYDFSLQNLGAFGASFPLSPYLGGGVAISTEDGDVGGLVTGGIDYRITPQFTATAAVNAAFYGDTDVGVVIGVGYNFSGLFGL